ncbi:hypothetical protein [Hymenobacter sp. PAMC 26628]|uniref:hypothetical protein n=1 Tax=Hymenobacter sp. PAMC 26628 TaxID=1484118 RepID=UPI00076FE584|nr:hypothetical protein [Hymenobacter sp. PAMC 26628]AMJ65339.1 hypothetical protein AXW84_07765 [Hymenobacter sp. PAMC 26628]
MTKETLKTTIDQLPDKFELEELIDRLIYIEKIEQGFAAAERGESKTHEEVKELVKSWRK